MTILAVVQALFFAATLTTSRCTREERYLRKISNRYKMKVNVKSSSRAQKSASFLDWP